MHGFNVKKTEPIYDPPANLISQNFNFFFTIIALKLILILQMSIVIENKVQLNSKYTN